MTRRAVGLNPAGELPLELDRVFLFRDAFHVVLPVVASIARRLPWKTYFVGQLNLAAGGGADHRPGMAFKRVRSAGGAMSAADTGRLPPSRTR